MSWTKEQVMTFAPDVATAKRGQGLASERHWRLLEGNEYAIWGECKSSSLSYYKVQIDLSGPAFKCNCPSRKFPCKHAIALLLIFISRSEAFYIRSETPPWVSEWLSTRVQQETQAADPAVIAERLEKNNLQRQKNRNKRLEQMVDGVKDLETWLLDLIRQGLASTEQLEYSYWQDIGARMVDNKLGGIGLKIRSLPLLQGGNTDWPEQMLSELAELYLLSRSLHNLESLPEAMQEQVLAIAGRSIRQDDLKDLPGVVDDWIVMGQFTGINIDNGTYRRTWLIGAKTQKKALILEFDYRDSGFAQDWPVGRQFHGELVYYPGTYPLRVLVKQAEFLKKAIPFPYGHSTLSSFLDEYASAVAANPWLLDFPAYLEEVRPVYDQQELVLIDSEKKSIPLINRDQLPWKILALSGGHPITIFGEWTGKRLVPLTIIVDNRLINL